MVGACSRGENRGKGRVATKHDSLGTAKLLHRSRNLGETFTYLALTTSVWIRDRSLGDTSQTKTTYRQTIHAGVCRRPYLVPRDSTPAERMPPRLPRHPRDTRPRAGAVEGNAATTRSIWRCASETVAVVTTAVAGCRGAVPEIVNLAETVPSSGAEGYFTLRM